MPATPARRNEENEMGKFIGYTVGLECFVDYPSKVIRPIKIEYSEAEQGVKLQAVSGNNLSSYGGKYSKIISREAFDARPVDAYKKTQEAIWALKIVGLTPAAL